MLVDVYDERGWRRVAEVEFEPIMPDLLNQHPWSLKGEGIFYIVPHLTGGTYIKPEKLKTQNIGWYQKRVFHRSPKTTHPEEV